MSAQSSPERVLITGATGGLGGALVREALSRGWQVRGTGRAAFDWSGVEYVRADLATSDCDLAALVGGCDTVIHNAALSASWGTRAEFQRINVTATHRLLEAAQQAGVKRFTFVSSPSIFASFRDRIQIGPDDAPANPQLNHYARTKLEAERRVRAANSASMATCAIRPRALVGEGDRVIVPRLIELARRPRVPLPRGGVALLEPTDLRDAAWAVCEAAGRCEAIGGRALNISGGQPIAARDLAQAVADALGTAPHFANLPAAPARIIATVLEGIARMTRAKNEPVLTRYTLAAMSNSQTFDLEPAQQLLGYEPRHDAIETLLTEVRNLA
ncbi:MAG: NAD-dependent epimerase/dehydratase family protein [Erythrobacter sp.]|nr:MAG: NAD-dependent epimerase/dehydratase family protein [Erythrobacter sp.]